MLSDPAVHGVVVNAHDVTERRALEEQLRQAQKMEAVGQLAGGVAHDFNNLLQAISGYGELAELAFDEEDVRGVRESLAEIQVSSSRGAAIVRQLLTFARQDELETAPLDLADVLAGARELVQRMIGEQVSLELDAPRGLGQVLADRVQIEQVVMNMAVNARDAIPESGRLTIALVEAGDELRFHPELLPGRYLCLSFEDDGCGMSEETQRRIFEPFYTTKEVGKGTGLGLSTTYNIVKNAGGTVDVESVLGQGTTFRVYLPIAGTLERDAARAVAAGMTGKATTPLLPTQSPSWT
jgi:signal transduction histidine kinase